jgi:hypothetical protein
MTSASFSRHDEPWLRPWTWATTGLALCFTSGVWLLVGGGSFEAVRLSLLWLGALAAGIGVALRFRAAPLGRPANAPGVVHLFLALIFGLLALALSVMLIASWFGAYLIGLRPGLAFVVWMLIAPMSARAGWQALERLRTGSALTRAHECALMLVMAALTAFMACFALANPDWDQLSDWFTLQRFLYVLGLVALAAAPLTAVDDMTRRGVVSGLILFHVLGLATAAFGMPPTPWVVTQLWTRIYRPYLEFMYLNNAYHFYSPEPGPPSHLWFRVYFTDENKQPRAVWYKIPRLREDGHHGHATSLVYQRHLSITENSMPIEGFAADNPQFEKIAERRLAWSPEGAKKDPVIGKNAPKLDLVVPLNPRLPRSQQYRPPQPYVRRFLESYTRHVVHKVAPEHPTWEFKRVRVYRIVHQIPPSDLYLMGVEATDPEFYLPVYMGEFDERGKLLNEDDPLLYWMLPILRDPPQRLDSPIRDWARRHAGDPFWIRNVTRAGFIEWVDDDGKPAPE